MICLLYNRIMNGEIPPDSGNRFWSRVHEGAKILLQKVCFLQTNIANGFSQANLGEAGMRTTALQDIETDQQIKALNLNPASDYVPE